MSSEDPPGDPSGALSSRRRRISDTETRRLMLTAATDVLLKTGLTVSLEHLSYEAVIQRAGVSRSAAYRIWPSKEDFFDDLLCEMAGPEYRGTAALDHETINSTIATVLDRAGRLSSAQGRLDTLVEAARIGALRNFHALIEQPEWRTYVALNATVLSMRDQALRERLERSLEASESAFLETMAAFYAGMSRTVGFRMKEPFRDQYTVLAGVAAAVVEGLGLRRIVSPDLVGRTFRLAAFGSSEEAEWSVPALGFTAILFSMIEPDPDFRPPDPAAVEQALRVLQDHVAAAAAAVVPPPEPGAPHSAEW